ncbi:GntR family transcriptional regulator [Cryobacterium fucosi]|uniref:GntR family transcriptional regulator n=1 Tax=Cryobacterium fucosi TaxID=1259157 RepID=A0A4R9BES2_9MICO|nr:GntR family transcriptional regulator [Cryobacterium fucosi]TFD82188.1 GntR family transcriptional regulator [Cryobacterium fucosi]
MSMSRSPRVGAAGPSAVERVYAHVAEAIITGAVGASSLLTEGDVAETLGISRTPVREAFLALEAHGLLTLFPKKGAVVTALDDVETAELLQVRIMFETTAVSLHSTRPGADRAVDDDLAVLILLQEEAARTGDVLAFARADHRFHARVVDESHNRVIDDFYTQLGPRLKRLLHRAATRDPGSLERFITEHRALADYLRAGDAPGYEAALRRHVRHGFPAPPES